MEFKKKISLILALPFLLQNKIYNAFVEIKNLINDLYGDEHITEFFNYLELTYLGTIVDERELKDPLYNINEWSIHDSVLKSLPRTNNTVEAWHRGFNATIQTKRPNIAYLINKLLLTEDKDKYNILQAKNGANLWSDQNFKKEKILINITQTADSLSNLEYLKLVVIFAKFNFN